MSNKRAPSAELGDSGHALKKRDRGRVVANTAEDFDRYFEKSDGCLQEREIRRAPADEVRVGPKRMTCATCGVELPVRVGRTRKWCDEHTPAEYRVQRAYYARHAERLRKAQADRQARKRASES